MYMIAIRSFGDYKPRNSILYYTKREALEECARLNTHYAGDFRVFDVDHYPGKYLVTHKRIREC